MKKRDKNSKSKQKILKAHVERNKRELPYQHGFEVNGTLKADYIRSGTIACLGFRSP